jgi:hypothetical protein
MNYIDLVISFFDFQLLTTRFLSEKFSKKPFLAEFWGLQAQR